MSVPTQEQIAAFLADVERDHGQKLRASCEQVLKDLKDLPRDKPWNLFYVFRRAKLRLQEPMLQDIAAMNAMVFASARNRDE